MCIRDRPYARECNAVAECLQDLNGEESARPWLERAATAPRSPEPGASGTFNFTRAGWARIVMEFMTHGRLAPPPLEDRVEALSHDTVKLLEAPAEPTPDPEASETVAPSEEAGDDKTKDIKVEQDAKPLEQTEKIAAAS